MNNELLVSSIYVSNCAIIFILRKTFATLAANKKETWLVWRAIKTVSVIQDLG